MTMRIAHLADLHFCEERFAEAHMSIKTVIAAHESDAYDAILIAGDIWHGPVQNSARAKFGEFLGLIRELADCAPVGMIYGTPSHDTEGSLEVFESIKARHQVTILRPGIAYGLGDFRIYELAKSGENGRARALLFGVPEPNKKWLLANAGAIGKGEADEAVRSAMGALFLRLGGMRRQHPELPCVLMYHGQVAGSKSGTGFTVETGSGLSVMRDQLATVGADYIALGDIHEPQQIAGIPAYYPGSIYPINWGETHQTGCNVVEIGNEGWVLTHNDVLFGDHEENGKWHVEVERLDFPHPLRVKINRKVNDGIAYNDYDVGGKLVWEEWTLSREEAVNVDVSDVLQFIIEACGALPGSRVTLNILLAETIRAGEIATKKDLADKVAIWGENSSLSIPESVLQKARDIEREAATRGSTASGSHIKITRLRLKGSKGIWKNQKKDEIDLDLEKYGPGVIALIGKNGMGKTTIIENMHPWPRMLTRDGTVKSHFRLRDSERDLYFTDLKSGWKYRARIIINAATASGSAEYWLYCDKGNGFEPVAGISGRLDAYEEAIGSLFGSLEMYLRTAFVTQRPTKTAPDISEATKGERKALFGELSGIDYLETHRASAKGKGDALDVEIQKLDAAIAFAGSPESEIESAESEIMDGKETAQRFSILALSILDRGKILKAERETIALRVSDLDRKIDRAGAASREIATLSGTIGSAEREILTYETAAGKREQAHRNISEAKACDETIARLKELRDAHLAAERKRNDAFMTAYQAASETRNCLASELSQKERSLAIADKDLSIARSKLSAPVVDTCPTCGQALPREKLDAIQTARKELETLIESLSNVYEKIQIDVDEAKKALGSVVFPVKDAPIPFSGAKELDDALADRSFYDVDSDRAIIQKADEAAVRIEGLRARIAESTEKAEALRAELFSLESAIRIDTSKAELSRKESELEAARAEYQEAASTVEHAKATTEAAERRLLDAYAKRDRKAQAEKDRADKAAELADWRMLERACGPDGIQALELDALAPSIASVANRLFADAYGSRYAIRFDTTRIGGKGAKAKQIEDFLVMVTDSESGEEQEISTLSGGESVWIKRALYDAFSVIRARNTDVRFMTAFQDETDGALDPEARMQYLRMLEAAHRESGRYQTILITHSTELQAMVQSTINVADLGAA